MGHDRSEAFGPLSGTPEPITRRQLEVARLVAEGKTNPEIAAELGISLDGAKYHVSELLGRLGLERREQIVAWYREQGGAARRGRARAVLAGPLLWIAAGGAAAAAAVGVVLLFVALNDDGASQPVDRAGANGEPVATETPPPATTAEPTPTPEPSDSLRWPAVDSALVVTNNLNVRMWPDTAAPVIGQLNDGDRVDVSGRSEDSAWLALTGTGWMAYSTDWMQLDGDMEALPALDDNAVTGPLHDPGTRSGIPIVDEVIAAVETGDAASLAGLVVFTTIPCGPQEGPGSPPECPEGIASGTPVDVLPIAGCEGEYLHPDRLAEWFETRFWQAGPRVEDRLRVYAVVDASTAPSSDRFPAGDYMIVFGFPDGGGRALHVAPDGIIQGVQGCQVVPPLLPRPFQGDVSFFLRPPAPAPLEPVQ